MTAMPRLARHDQDQLFDPLRRARELADDFSKAASHFDRTGEFAQEHISVLHEAGLLRALSAREDGGLDGGVRLAHRLVTEIATGDPSTALVLTMHYSIHTVIRRGGWPATLAARVLAASRNEPALLNNAQAEPGIGSPAHGALPETTAHIDGGDWVINGRKSFVTGLPGLKWAVVLAVTREEPARLIQVLVPLDAPGVASSKAWNATGMFSTASDDLVLNDVRVPLEDVVAEQPASEALRRDEFAGSTFFTLLASVYHGVALAAQTDLVCYLAGRVPTSLGTPLSSVPRLQEGVGQIEVLLSTNRRLLASMAEDVDAGRAAMPDALAVRYTVIDNAIAVTDLALELGGNGGLQRDQSLERHHRNAITARAHAPQNHMIRTILGKAAFARESAN